MRVMRLWRSPLATTFLLGAAVTLLLLALAGVLSLSGQSLLGLKIAVFVVLFPGIPILAAGLLVTLRLPGRGRTSRGVSAVLVTAGGLLVLVPLLAWLPFWPGHPHIGHLPLVLAVPFVMGVGLLAAGVSSIFLESLVEDWREHAYPEALANFVAILGVVWIASWLVSNRLN